MKLSTIEKLKEIVSISGTPHEDLPILIGEINSKEGQETLKRAINGETRLSINNIEDLRSFLDKERLEENIQNYYIQEKYDGSYEVIVKPNFSVNHLVITFKSNGEVSELV